ncbi:MAG: isoprenyl transferase [Phycisphaerae bacterium]
MSDSPLDPNATLGLTRAELPRHVAIIMDGNGRWAKQRGWPRIRGHERGARNVRRVVTHCARLGIETLTLYSFSTENWKRPKEEVDFLMDLYVRYLIAERSTIMDNNVRFLHLGRREGLPSRVLAQMDETVSMSRTNTGLRLCLALNYGSRNELIDAIRAIAGRVAAGTLAPHEIDEQVVCDSLYTAGLADPDLLIRTANERRISNFLLWQISYAELYICDRLWPEFGEQHLNEAIREYARRERRFGHLAVKADSTEPS